MQRQLAIKILVIFVVGALILIPVSMVKYKIVERKAFRAQAIESVARGWTGRQLLTTPVVVIPYQRAPVAKSGFYSEVEIESLSGDLIVLPEQVQSTIEVANRKIFKGIYGIAVFDSESRFSGTVKAETLARRIAALKQTPGFVSVGTPYLALHVTDARGIGKSPSLSVNDEVVPLQPGSGIRSMTQGLHAELKYPAGSMKDLSFSLSLPLRGMDSLSFVHLAEDATTEMRSDWPHPQFTGNLLPHERQVSSSGFQASWVSSRYSNNSAALLQHCIGEDSCERLLTLSSGVKFMEPVDVYLQSERSVKYALLFIGLSFVSFFIFEQLKRVRIHPIQYAFVGLAIAVFYLLLISLAEHVAFYLAYLAAVICCTGLLLFYVRHVLRSLAAASLFSLMITGLYGLLYVIVQAEDFALLMGTVLVFLVLSILMYVTRQIDWYKLAATEDEG